VCRCQVLTTVFCRCVFFLFVRDCPARKPAITPDADAPGPPFSVERYEAECPVVAGPAKSSWRIRAAASDLGVFAGPFGAARVFFQA